MHSLILHAATRFLFPMLLLFAVYLLLRGHNEPGGGFVGGLIATSAFSLHLIANEAAETRRVLRVHPRVFIGIGLSIAVLSGCFGLVSEEAFLTGAWHSYPVPVVGKLGTPLLFDVGVFFVVFGSAITIVLTLAEG